MHARSCYGPCCGSGCDCVKHTRPLSPPQMMVKAFAGCADWRVDNACCGDLRLPLRCACCPRMECHCSGQSSCEPASKQKQQHIYTCKCVQAVLIDGQWHAVMCNAGHATVLEACSTCAVYAHACMLACMAANQNTTKAKCARLMLAPRQHAKPAASTHVPLMPDPMQFTTCNSPQMSRRPDQTSIAFYSSVVSCMVAVTAHGWSALEAADLQYASVM
jgi:hypothetical protein